MADVNVGTFVPTIAKVTAALADGKIDAQERVELINEALRLIAVLMTPTSVPAAPAPAPVVPVVTAPPAPVAPAPVAPTPTGRLDIAALRIAHGIIEDRNGRELTQAEIDNIDKGNGNIDDGSRLHTDCSPFMEDGTELSTGDPRWATVRRGVLGDMKPLAIWIYYVADGKSTLDGHHAPWVEPESVEDDERCTVTYRLKPTDKQQHTFAYGYQYLRWDGRLVDPGPIGRNNKPLNAGGQPFTIR